MYPPGTSGLPSSFRGRRYTCLVPCMILGGMTAARLLWEVGSEIKINVVDYGILESKLSEAVGSNESESKRHRSLGRGLSMRRQVQGRKV